MKRARKVLRFLAKCLRLRRGPLSILGVSSICVAGFSVALWLGYTLVGIGLIALDDMLFGSDNAKPSRRGPQ